MRVVSILITFCCLFRGTLLPAQGTRADYERADRLAREVRGKVLNQKLELHWFAQDMLAWYRVDLGDGQCEFRVVDANTGNVKPAFDHAKLAKKLGQEQKRELDPQRLALEGLKFADDGKGLSFTHNRQTWRCNLITYKVERLTEEIAADNEQLMPPKMLLEQKPSSRTGQETYVRFENKLDVAIELFWSNSEGELKSYGKVQPAESQRQHTFAGHVWVVKDAHGGMLQIVEAADHDTNVLLSPAKKSPAESKPNPASDEAEMDQKPGRPREGTRRPRDERVILRNDNVFFRDSKANEERQLTTDGTPENSYNGRVRWSPDGNYFVVMRTQPAEKHPVYIVESSPRDQVQPKLFEHQYLKPGDRVEVSKPALFEAATGKRIELDDSLYKNPWSITEFRWEADSSRFTFLFNQRGHQTLRLVAVDVSGKTQAIVNEESKTFITYSSMFFLERLPKTNELIWMSERDGWNHLYLYDATSGAVKNQITRGEWVIRGVERVDADKRQIWFRAGGLDPEQDPYYVHHCRIDFDGQNLVRLTHGDGTHTLEYSPNRKFYVDTYSRVDQPPVHELRRASDGKLVAELLRTDLSRLAKTGWRAPERFVAKGRDGKTDIFGIICRPSNFDPQKKYPVIERIYAGPHGAFVPKSFKEWQGNLQTYAELGFILVSIDGMGTSYRSKAFHDVCWQNLADAGFPDRISWLQAAAKHEPALDLTRVGIFGGSAGGQNALGALLTHGDFYKAAVADCGCHDNRMDKIWWNEQWMGYPIGKHYEEQSNVTLAKNLKGKLLLTVGELDKNVDPASTMQVVNALIKADKDFDLLVVPGADHGAGEKPYADRRRRDFFVRHLLGVEPRL
jgi:dipeptidyl-peptidase-4